MTNIIYLKEWLLKHKSIKPMQFQRPRIQFKKITDEWIDTEYRKVVEKTLDDLKNKNKGLLES